MFAYIFVQCDYSMQVSSCDGTRERPNSLAIYRPSFHSISCFTLSHSGTTIAVGCVGNKPNVYIYNFSSFTLQKILRNGTERGYASTRFTADGEMLSTVGMKPDFLLTVWDWQVSCCIELH